MHLKKLWIIATALIITLTTSNIEALQKPQCEFAITCIFRNEAEYLKEWIEFHKLVGAERFYLINHLSTDNYLEILKPYINNGEVELIDWPYEHKQGESFGTVTQRKAYNHTIGLARGKVKWMAFIDVDEFLFTLNGEKIPAVINSFVESKKISETCGGLFIPWLMFGTSHINKIPGNQSLIETLTLCAEKHEKRGKTITFLDRIEGMHNAHVAVYRQGYESSTLNTEQNMQLNHYFTRDEDFFWNRKIAVKQSIGGMQTAKLVTLRDEYNKASNSAILRYVPALRKSLKLSKIKEHHQ